MARRPGLCCRCAARRSPWPAPSLTAHSSCRRWTCPCSWRHRWVQWWDTPEGHAPWPPTYPWLGADIHFIFFLSSFCSSPHTHPSRRRVCCHLFGPVRQLRYLTNPHCRVHIHFLQPPPPTPTHPTPTPTHPTPTLTLTPKQRSPQRPTHDSIRGGFLNTVDAAVQIETRPQVRWPAWKCCL